MEGRGGRATPTGGSEFPVHVQVRSFQLCPQTPRRCRDPTGQAAVTEDTCGS